MCVLLVAALAATFITLPVIDYVEPSALFYLRHLTPLYYGCLFLAIFMAIYWRRSYVGLFSVIVIALLVLWTPSVMMYNPWFPDTYPFVSEAVYVARNGHLGDIHYLSEYPVLGLVFGPLLIVTGMNSFMLQTIYPALFAIILVVLLYLVAEKMNLDKGSLIFAPLFFVAIAWPNELHLNRQSFSLIYYVASYVFLFHVIFQKQDFRVFSFLSLQVLLMVMAHPATPFFFIFNLAAIIFLGLIWSSRTKKEFKLRGVTLALFISASLWSIWNFIIPHGAIISLASVIDDIFKSLVTEGRIGGVSTVFADYTPIYKLIINVRLVVTLLAYCFSLISSFIIYKYVKNKSSAVLAGWSICNIFSTAPILFAGYALNRPSLFTFISWAPLGALIVNILTVGRKHPNLKKMVGGAFVIVLVIIPLLLIPVIKYGPVPFLYPTSDELAQRNFVDSFFSKGNIVYLEFNFPYYYSYTMLGSSEYNKTIAMWDVWDGQKLYIGDSLAFVILDRLLTRDAFYNYEPSMLKLVENLTAPVPYGRYDKVYDSGWPNSVYVPTP